MKIIADYIYKSIVSMLLIIGLFYLGSLLVDVFGMMAVFIMPIVVYFVDDMLREM